MRIALLAIILMVVIGIAGINVQSARKNQEYNRHMEAAEKYLSDLDYEQAIAEYKLAMEIEPKEEVLDALEQTYLAYAQTVADAGDLERAVAILQEGYAVTGRESLQEKIRELESSVKEAQSGEAEVAQAEGIIEFPFEVTDITIKGYDLLSDHYNEVIAAYGFPPPGVENGYMVGMNGELQLSMDGFTSTIGENFNQLGIHLNNSSLNFQVYHYENNGQCGVDWYGAPGDDLSSYDIILPVDLKNSYEDWCQVMQVERIKETGEKVEIEEGGFGEGGDKWIFQTKWGQGEYLEFLMGNGSLWI